MICEVCRQRDADIVFKTVTGGQVATRAMCMKCAQNMQQEMMKMFVALGFKPEQVSGVHQEETSEAALPKPEMPRFLCAHCGRPYDRLDEHTMAGCAHCYEAMAEDLAAQFAPDTAPKAADSRGNARGGHDELNLRLMEAVIREDFELAARLRDQLRTRDQEGPAE
ncbi:MAG: hypothetical protein GX623_01330 [Clostridiales bacterium]|nr:hypothetical protein [Clostridiales bacterium]